MTTTIAPCGDELTILAHLDKALVFKPYSYGPSLVDTTAFMSLVGESRVMLPGPFLKARCLWLPKPTRMSLKLGQ